jgi:hypothetical protein
MTADTYVRRATLVGRPNEVANVLVTARDHGRLVRFSEPTYLADGRVRVDLVTREPVPARRSVLHRTLGTARRTVSRPYARPAESPVKPVYARARTWYTAAAVTAAVAVLGGLAYVLWLAYVWLVAHFAIIVGCAVLALIVAGLSTNASRGHWHHGRGC